MTRQSSFAILFVLASTSAALAHPKFSDWARDPATGLKIANAQVTVRNEEGALASLFRDAAGTMRLPNPLTAGATGYFEFYAPAGEVRLSVARSGKPQLYALRRLLIDPTGPLTIRSSAEPALKIVQVGPDDLYVPEDPNNTDPFSCYAQSPTVCPAHWAYHRYATSFMQFERRTADGLLAGAPWLFAGNRAEQSINFNYNTFARAPGGVLGDPIVPGIPARHDLLGFNTADFGNFGVENLAADYNAGGIVSFGFGVVLAPEMGTALNVDMLVDGPAPTPGSVVMISPTVNNAVREANGEGVRFPMVVTTVQGNHAIVALMGVADVKVTGPVAIGDPLISSATPGYAQAASGAPAPITLGSAVTGSTGGGTVGVHIGMVGR